MRAARAARLKSVGTDLRRSELVVHAEADGVHHDIHIGDAEVLLGAEVDVRVFDPQRQVLAQHVLDAEAGVAQRATYIVDPQGVIRFAYVTDLNVGRSPEEVLRVLDALQTDELCPCNWKKGEDTLKVA